MTIFGQTRHRVPGGRGAVVRCRMRPAMPACSPRRLLKKAWPPIGGCWGIWDGFVMQGFERSDRELPDAAALAGHLVPAGSMFAFLAVHRAEVFRAADYADLFAPGAGRPSLPPPPSAARL